MLQVRICSCPKRDKEKAEKEFQKEGYKEPIANGKKRKVDKALDLQEYKVQFKVVGKHNYIKVLQYAADLMRSEAYLHGSTAEPAFKKPLTELNNLLSKSLVIFFVSLIFLFFGYRNSGSFSITPVTVPFLIIYIFVLLIFKLYSYLSNINIRVIL